MFGNWPTSFCRHREAAATRSAAEKLSGAVALITHFRGSLWWSTEISDGNVVIGSWGTCDEELHCLPGGESAGNPGFYREDWVFSALFTGQKEFIFCAWCILGIHQACVDR